MCVYVCVHRKKPKRKTPNINDCFWVAELKVFLIFIYIIHVFQIFQKKVNFYGYKNYFSTILKVIFNYRKHFSKILISSCFSSFHFTSKRLQIFLKFNNQYEELIGYVFWSPNLNMFLLKTLTAKSTSFNLLYDPYLCI